LSPTFGFSMSWQVYVDQHLLGSVSLWKQPKRKRG
jgi:hypothetical protein